MEQSFADLLSDAFSETSGPVFVEDDMDFENLNFGEENKTGISEESQQTKEDNGLHQEATSAPQAEDVNMAETDDKGQSDEEDFQGVGVTSVDKTQEEGYTSSEEDSEQEGSVSEDDEDSEEEEEEEDLRAGEEPGDLLMSVCCAGYREEMILVEGLPPDPQGAENAQDRNTEQGEKEVSYFERVPERGSEMGIKGDGSEDDEKEREEAKQEDSSDSEHEDMKIKQEEEEEEEEENRCFVQEVENPYREDHEREKWSLEFPEISVRNLQDLLAEVEGEESVENVEDFSGEEHQEAGESFADYPSDFSSCEYVEEKHQLRQSSSDANQDASLEGDRTCAERGEDIDKEEDEYLYSRNLEDDDDDYLRDLNGTSGRKDEGMLELPEGDAGCDDDVETDPSDSCSSSDDKDEVKRSDEEPDIYTENKIKQLEETQLHRNSPEFSCWSTSGNYHRENAAGLDINWNPNVSTTSALQIEDLLTTEDIDRVETLLSDVTRPAEDVYLAVQRGDPNTTIFSNQGSVDDGFFFNTEVESSGVTVLSQQGDDEYEEERNWDQEQERIKAFYKFYDNGDKDEGGEERQTKVQFCADPLSRVIHFETDSDRDSTSTSTDVEEDLSSAETSEQELQEPVNNNMEKKPALDPPNTEIPKDVPDLRTAPVCTRKQKCVNMLKLTLKMVAVILMGLLMFWLVTDQGEMFNPVSFMMGKA
ncbi:FK506-binding protein 5 [Notolabrus celidotus]|uniref:FK506-binding protein 5 n=1 Tax=Notolabrus celidotus TaxID=1203425 RepID=UPI00148FED54|nr:FK506-binding protein 5 [Notolabrus celidotus]